jgi:hypothetical protein
LLVWCIFGTIEKKGKLDPAEARHFEPLQSTKIISVINGRLGILAAIERWVKGRTASAMVEKFQALLLEWHKVSCDANNDVLELLQSTSPDDNDFYKLTYTYFGKFLTTGVRSPCQSTRKLG